MRKALRAGFLAVLIVAPPGCTSPRKESPSRAPLDPVPQIHAEIKTFYGWLLHTRQLLHIVPRYRGTPEPREVDPNTGLEPTPVPAIDPIDDPDFMDALTNPTGPLL